VGLDQALLPVLRLHLAEPDGVERGPQRLGRHADLAQHLLRLAARLADRIGGLDHLRRGGAEEPARGPGGILLVGADAGSVLQDVGGGVPSRCSRRRTSCWSVSMRRCASFSLSTSIWTFLGPIWVSSSTSRDAC